MENGLEHFFINASSSHYFSKIDFKQYVFKVVRNKEELYEVK